MGLQVETLSGRVCRDQNADRILGRIRVERGLNRFAFVGRGGAMKDRDSFRTVVKLGIYR